VRTAIDRIKDMHIFIDPKSFPVAVFTHDEWEARELSYVKPEEHNTESLCRWCINHNIEYRLLYPLSITHFLRNPGVYYRYGRLKARLNRRRKQLGYE
jgi:hypothetical protein